MRRRRFDLAVSNPPYARVSWKAGFSRILSEACLDGFPVTHGSSFPTEILFLAQLLRLSRHGAEIGVIVPDGLVSARRCQTFRQALLERVRVTRVVQLPKGSFDGTDARAHVVVFANERARNAAVEVCRLGEDGVSAPIRIDLKKAALRMDYGFYRSPRDADAPHFTLRGIGADIRRGSLTSTEARASEEPTFHTTDFPVQAPAACRLSGACLGEDRPGRRVARRGDILLARVDRGLHRKVCLVVSGEALLTDCVYRIRVPESWRGGVASALLSEDGRSALARASRGVGAQMLGKADLLDIKLPVRPDRQTGSGARADPHRQ